MTGPGFGLVLLLAACILPGQSALLGSKKCTYGPGYWCDGLQNAKECHAVKHCIKAVWEKQQLPDDTDDICSLCKNMVKEARDQLLSNETQEEIREVFEGSCRLIPIRIITDECIHLADDFIPELIDTLASQMNPQMVCATAGLCNSHRIDRLLREHQDATAPEAESNAIQTLPVETPQPGDCEACKDFISRTIRLVKTHSRAELMNRLMAVCGRLGSLSDGCMALVEANFDGIYEFLTEQLTPDGFCNLVEMCESRMHQTEQFTRPALPRSGDEPCDFCVAIVDHWRTIMTSNTTEEEFKEILDGLCHQTGKFQKNCLALVDEYYLPLYNLMVSEIHPKEICEAVGLCGLNSVFNSEHPVWPVLDASDMIPQTPLVPSLMVAPRQHLIGGDESAAIQFENENTAQTLPRVQLSSGGIGVSSAGRNGMLGAPVGKGRVGDDNKCVMCEFALNFLQKMLEQKDTREDIEQAVENLCDVMPHSLAEQCEDYVEAYGDQVIELLAQEIDPTQICTMIHLCSSVSELEENEAVSKPDVTCVMCEYALTQVEDMLEDNKTEASIIVALDKICAILPKSVKAECKVFVELYTDQVIQMLINNLSPDEICTELGLCKDAEAELPELNGSNQLPLTRMIMPLRRIVEVPEGAVGNVDPDMPIMVMPLKQTAVCVLCEFMMVEVGNLLDNNKTEDKIIEVVDFVCAHLPGVLADDCIGFVEQYGDVIIQVLAHELATPLTLCTEINLCKRQSYLGSKAMANLSLDKCDMCEGIVDYIDEKLRAGEATRIIDNVLEGVCALIPGPTKKTCISMVEVYGPYIASLLAELGDSKRVCQAIRMCPHHTSDTLLGAEKCTWGPSYWCQTKLHASACKATSHCETEVWDGVEPSI